MPLVFIESDRGHVVLNVLRMLVSFSEVVASESSGNSERSEEEDSEPDTEPETEPENPSQRDQRNLYQVCIASFYNSYSWTVC